MILRRKCFQVSRCIFDGPFDLGELLLRGFGIWALAAKMHVGCEPIPLRSAWSRVSETREGGWGTHLRFEPQLDQLLPERRSRCPGSNNFLGVQAAAFQPERTALAKEAVLQRS